jgi:hypothetical protein
VPLTVEGECLNGQCLRRCHLELDPKRRSRNRRNTTRQSHSTSVRSAVSAASAADDEIHLRSPEWESNANNDDDVRSVDVVSGMLTAIHGYKYFYPGMIICRASHGRFQGLMGIGGNRECLRPNSFSATQPWFVQMLQISFEKCRFHSVSARVTFFK